MFYQLMPQAVIYSISSLQQKESCKAEKSFTPLFVMSKAITLNLDKLSCLTCRMAMFCSRSELWAEELNLPGECAQHLSTVEDGARVFRAGRLLKYLYVVRAGSIKTIVCDGQGEERIMGFHMPGDVLGLEAISTGAHTCAAVALEKSSICHIPYRRLQRLCSHEPELCRDLAVLISDEITHKHQMMLILGRNRAAAKIAALLVNLSTRFRGRGFPAQRFSLSMSRHDIGCFLGLALETVSRLLGKIQQKGIIEVDRRSIRILDLGQLQELAQG